MESTRLPRNWIYISLFAVLLAGFGVFLVWRSKFLEERELYAEFSSSMKPAAEVSYEKQGLLTKLKIARVAARNTTEFQRANWVPSLDTPVQDNCP
ncbi:MAG: hypothetical protein KDD47_09090, partial [Acidobacteria bacterium]|nr:hypothetical protein [Acidobacteriota bacterium]